MARELTRNTVARGRRRYVFDTNTIAFPSTLRDAIPELPTCSGRVLKLESIDAEAGENPLSGPRVRLRLLANETGKLTGEFPVIVDLDPAAARALAETLGKLAGPG